MVGAVFLVSPALAQSSQLDASSSAVPLEPAELRAEQLDALFALLHQPGTVGGPVEQQIWQLWNSSDSHGGSLASAIGAGNRGAGPG